MKSVTGREFARLIERRGWTLLRVSGSHHIYGKSRQRRAAISSNPRQQTVEDRLAATFDEARGPF
jgi:predicted RNA binding protein YcfA (HicA-like mRNA interferase family)